jgi:hypothetical protein
VKIPSVNKNGIPIFKHEKPEKRTEIKPNGLLFEPLDERALYLRQNGKCFYCLLPMEPAPHSKHHYANGWTRDHFYAKHYGNIELAGNMVLAHNKCNSEKSNDVPTIKEMHRFKILYADNDVQQVFGKPVTVHSIVCRYSILGCAHVEDCKKKYSPDHTKCGYYGYFKFLDKWWDKNGGKLR